MRSKSRHDGKFRFAIKKMHIYYATKVNPRWTYKELLISICERLTNKQLSWIISSKDKYYEPIVEHAKTELLERELLLKPMIQENMVEVYDHYVLTKKKEASLFRELTSGDKVFYESEEYT